ncbi:MAG: DUF4838 domain-containing protein [Chryseolinea sp.]
MIISFPSAGWSMRLLAVFVISTCAITTTTAQKKKVKKAATSKVAELVLAENKQSRYRIVIPSSSTADETRAAEVLQSHLLEISDAALPIVKADKSRSPYEIVIGQNERLDELQSNINLNSLREDGFLIKTDSARLIIAGGSEKGALYGVYSFLESYLNCRMYSPSVKVIPKGDRVVIPLITEDKQVPPIGFRDTHYRGSWDPAYTEWHKLDHGPDGERPNWGMFVHTFNTLVPPDVYYGEHPEYFAMVKGARIPTQLCLTNKAVLELTIQSLRRKIAANPGALYWSVSQNDNREFCTCDNCRAIDEREGSPSGSIIQFVNQVADAFPDKMISTLAYEYGRHAPKTLKPRDNVNIMLCSIEAYRDKPLEQDPHSADFVQDVKDWGKIAKDIIIWDYVIQFNHLVSPFPNLHVLQPNLQFFVRNGVNAMFEQGNREVGGEFAELRAYMISKLMWNPDADANVIMNDFLQGYYGAAATPIRTYIDEMKEALLRAGQPLRIFGTPNEASTSYLTPPLMERYSQLFDEAERAVQKDSILLERVKFARQPLIYATLEQAKKNYVGDHGIFEKSSGQWRAKLKMRELIDPFTDLCLRQGVSQLKEWSCTPEEYRSAFYRMLSQGMNEHLAYKKKVTFVTPNGSTLPPAAGTMLTDGFRGAQDYDYNWMSVGGKENLELIIDLEASKPVRRIESSFYQYGFWLKLLPRKVEYYTSTDGVKYELAASIQNTLPIDQYGGRVRDFASEFPIRDARYVKVIAYTIGNTPDWHPGAGRPANMLVDEIVVE